ncbi:hypothetical protein AB4305_00440 [Nocardia sp. 2YAB30]|uniref:hypothetical protein n=1 Tax=unclassified Nocardia TaxID=2637762 RepID=UPI003F9BBC0A
MTLIGHVGVYAMGRVDDRHIHGCKDFQVNDVENDGRYVTFGTRTLTIKPATAERIAATLQQMIGRTVTPLAQPGPPGWSGHSAPSRSKMRSAASKSCSRTSRRAIPVGLQANLLQLWANPATSRHMPT